MNIVYDLLPKQRTHKHNLQVEIDLYPLATELYEELNRIGIIDRIKEIPQLGVIKVSKKLSKTRYDYIMLQLYLHKLIKNNLQSQLRFTYNNNVSSKVFRDNYKYIGNSRKTSIGDILQLLTIVYNIGHFYNTFTSSKAIVIKASEDERFYNTILNASDSKRYKDVAEEILQRRNYQRLHLLNSILVLEKCDHTKQSVSLGLEILYSYMQGFPIDDKLSYIFSVFKKVRTVSYMAYDLQISETPLTIDLCNEKAILLLLRELLSEYNNNQPSNDLVMSITKLLDDTVYNESSHNICYHKISRRMVSYSLNETEYQNYYSELFLEKNSVFNRIYKHKIDYVPSQILKITFEKENKKFSESLLSDLERINNTRVGYYDRNSGEQTILVSIKKNCNSYSKRIAAFKTMKLVVTLLRKISVESTDVRYLLCTKFFLFYLFDENPILIKPTISKNICVICTRGKKSRITKIKSLLENSIGNGDENHEADLILQFLKEEKISDTSITIPASIVVYKKNAVGQKLSEFDGMIIHPMRDKEQIIFLEAKNTSQNPSFGRKCLKEKLDKYSFLYSPDSIKKFKDYDAFFKYSI